MGRLVPEELSSIIEVNIVWFCVLITSGGDISKKELKLSTWLKVYSFLNRTATTFRKKLLMK